MIENIKPVESLTVADFQARPVWEWLNDDEIGETMLQPVEMLPVESLDWFHLARYFDVGFSAHSPDALARFLGLHVDDVFPIFVDVRRYVRGDPAALTAIVLKEPQERLTREEIRALIFRKPTPNSA
jgi:hypothetical protein